MKKLSLLMFTILILACGTETTVVEKRPPVMIIDEPSHHPLIAHGPVKHGQVNVDPESLSNGFHFVFKEPIYTHWVTLEEKNGRDLSHWDSPKTQRWEETQHVLIHSIGGGGAGAFKYDTEYELMITVQHFNCDTTDIVIQFRTKPQRHVVGRPEPVIQERRPVVTLGEHFRFDITFPHIVDGDVAHRANNVDPEPLNANGIQFEFNHGIKKYEIDLRLKDGASLGWLPRGLVDNKDLGKRIKIMPGEGAALLEFNTEYEIEICVWDFRCVAEKFRIVFRTKPKP